MGKSFFVETGHTYMAGASKPFFVSQGMIVSAAQKMGFTDVQVASRSDFPKASVPPLPAGTSDDWNVIGTGKRSLPNGAVDVPDGVRWLVDVSPSQKLDPNFERPPVTPGAPPSYLPPVYPTTVPAGVDWTTTPSGPLTLAVWAGLLGLVGALVVASWNQKVVP